MVKASILAYSKMAYNFNYLKLNNKKLTYAILA